MNVKLTDTEGTIFYKYNVITPLVGKALAQT